MKREVHHAALRAAARLALASFAVGCGGALEKPGAPDAAQPSAPPGPAASTAPPGDAARPDSARPDAASPDAPEAGPPSELACQEKIKAATAGWTPHFDRDKPKGTGPDGSPVAADVVACCDALLNDPGKSSGAFRDVCCTIQSWDWETYTACTPWGPPMPPSMPTRLSEQAGAWA